MHTVVELEGVADVPTFLNSTSGSNWNVDASSAIPVATKLFSEDEVIVLDIEFQSGEIPTRQTGDVSETLSMIFEVPPTFTVVNTSMLTFIGTNDAGNAEYEVKSENLQLVQITPPTHQTSDVTLNARVVVTEDDGDSLLHPFQIRIDIAPVIDAADYNGTIEAEECDDLAEDTPSRIDILPTDFAPFVDSQEEIVGVSFTGLPTGYQMFFASTLLIPDGSGVYTLTPTQVTDLVSNPNKFLEVLTALHADENPELIVTVTVQQTDPDGEATATKNIVGTVIPKIRGIVESDGVLEFQDSTNAVATIAQADTDNVITLGDPRLVFESIDLSSSEVVAGVILDFPPGLGSRYYVASGAFDGASRWFVSSQFENIVINAISPVAYPFEVLAIAQIVDQGHPTESEISCEMQFNTTLTLNFTAPPSPPCTTIPGDVTITDVVIQGQEDTLLDFGNQLVMSVNAADAGADELSILIPKATLETFPVVDAPGANYDFDSESYIFTVAVGTDGSVDLSGLSLVPPENYAGDFQFNFTVSTLDTACSGTKSFPASMKIELAPIVESPMTLSLEVLGASVEDEDVYLRVSVNGLTDLDPPTLGQELLSAFTVSPSPAYGTSEVLSINLTAGTADVKFTPTPDFSGEVTLDFTGTVEDTAVYDIGGSSTVTDSESFTESIAFDIDYACDNVTMIVPADFTTSEMTKINLGGIQFTPQDTDGSEKLVSVAMSEVPNKFFFLGNAVNTGSRQWILATPSGDLSGLIFRPPRFFSGVITFTLTGNVKEDLAPLSDLCTHAVEIVINVEPVADSLTSSILESYTGINSTDIELTLDLEVQDNVLQYPGEPSVVENPPETIRVTFTDVPTGAMITAPAGATSVQLSATTWQVDTVGTTLSSVTFNPGTNIGSFEVQLTAISIDSGVELTNDLALTRTLQFTISES